MTEKSWYYALNNEKQGPVPASALTQLVEKQAITKKTLVWCKTLATWTAAGLVEELNYLFSSPPPMPPEMAQTPQSGDPSRLEIVQQPEVGYPAQQEIARQPELGYIAQPEIARQSEVDYPAHQKSDWSGPGYSAQQMMAPQPEPGYSAQQMMAPQPEPGYSAQQMMAPQPEPGYSAQQMMAPQPEPGYSAQQMMAPQPEPGYSAQQMMAPQPEPGYSAQQMMAPQPEPGYSAQQMMAPQPEPGYSVQQAMAPQPEPGRFASPENAVRLVVVADRTGIGPEIGGWPAGNQEPGSALPLAYADAAGPVSAQVVWGAPNQPAADSTPYVPNPVAWGNSSSKAQSSMNYDAGSGTSPAGAAPEAHKLAAPWAGAGGNVQPNTQSPNHGRADSTSRRPEPLDTRAEQLRQLELDRQLDQAKQIDQSYRLDGAHQSSRPQQGEASPLVELARTSGYAIELADVSPHPWLRYFARSLDGGVFAPLLALLITSPFWIMGLWSIGVAAQQLQRTQGSTSSDPSLGLTALGVAGLLILAMVVAFVLYEPLCIGKFGSTLGKFLFNLRVTKEDGTPPALRKSFMRWLSMLLRTGLVFYYIPFVGPIVTLVMHVLAYNSLNDNGATAWDTDNGLVSSHNGMSVWRWIGVVGIFLGYVGVVAALVVMKMMTVLAALPHPS